MKSITVEKYFELIKPEYVYLKITPDKSIRNYNSTNIAKAICNTYRSLNRRIIREQKKLWFYTSFKISYILDISKTNTSFYFLVPRCFLSILIEKIREIWPKATLEEVDSIEDHKDNSTSYQLVYKKNDIYSLDVDKKNNEPLNSILNVLEIMKDDDRVTLIYNFIPRTQSGWKDYYDKNLNEIKAGTPEEKDKHSKGYILKTSLNTIVNLLNGIMDVLLDFMGGKTSTNMLETVSDMIKENKEFSNSTKAKKDTEVIDTQIVVKSSSNDKTRQINNAMSVCTSYRGIDGDNELLYKKCNDINICDTKFRGVDSNIFSVHECSNLISLPGKTLLKDFNINHVNITETSLPLELQKGTKKLGRTKYKNDYKTAYLEDEYNIGNLPLVLIGSQGSGKTTYLGQYSKYCSKAKESVIVIDIIKNCELSETIKNYTSKDKIVEIDLGKEESIQGLGYNEVKISKNATAFEKLKLANIMSQQVMSLIDSISVGDPLSSRMRKYLNAASMVTFVQGYTSVKNVVQCLENYERRSKYIYGLNGELREYLEEEISNLKELDEYSKPTKDNPIGEVIGTKDNKIEHILDRISLLREDFKTKFMYNTNLKNNIDLVECMEKGKVVLIKMKEQDFPSKMIKNVLVTYWISKVWLASQLRGGLSEKPSRSNIIVDEVFQAPTSLKILEYIIPQARKFGCKFVFSTQFMIQLQKISDVLEACGSSYMMLKGCLESDFNHFKNKIIDYEFDDLREMPQYNSFNLIYYSKGYSSFITELPKPI